ncbi:MAG: hypothetical protein H0W69_06180 [Gemmatimonadaceae bacterium]|nr:hypothetical protein [Gemmatimonadaceae bacterium]
MTGFRIRYSESANKAESGSLGLLSENGKLRVEGSSPLFQWKGTDGAEYFLIGQLVGIRNTDGSISKASRSPEHLRLFERTGDLPQIEGRFVVIRMGADKSVAAWTDQFGKIDVYYQVSDKETVVASNLSLLPVAQGGSSLDQIAAAHSLTVYGSRPAKKHTYYKDVRRLGVGEVLRIQNGQIEISRDPFIASPFVQYEDADLERYFEIFLEAIRSRASEQMNLVSLSSGWDSTSILGTLVHLYGNKKVRGVIARLRYTGRSGVINQFEIDRASAVAAYYGVPLDVVEYDFGVNGSKYFAEAHKDLRSNQMMSLSGLGNHRMYAHVAKNYANDSVFFTGEGSDGAHNFGFSQLVTMFHPASHEFREYADKMATFLYGPTFIRELYDGIQEKDPVWNLIRNISPDAHFDTPKKDEAGINKQILHSLFLRSNRTPFYSLRNSTLLTEAGREKYTAESDRTYFDDVRGFEPENVYSWYLHLYNSFYWQSTPVRAREVMADSRGVVLANPFHDSALISFLSVMPESWGRGLNLNSTKYPLKWMLSNKIDYPTHLQVGPHSYTYDVVHGFSIAGELLHASSLTDVFKDTLKNASFAELLDPALFDREYIDRVTKSYLDGNEARGEDLGAVYALATHSAVGLY